MAFAQYSSNNRTGLAACFGNYYQWGFQSAKLSAWYPPLPSTSKPQRPLGVQQIAPGVQLLPPPPPPPASAVMEPGALNAQLPDGPPGQGPVLPGVPIGLPAVSTGRAAAQLVLIAAARAAPAGGAAPQGAVAQAATEATAQAATRAAAQATVGAAPQAAAGAAGPAHLSASTEVVRRDESVPSLDSALTEDDVAAEWDLRPVSSVGPTVSTSTQKRQIAAGKHRANRKRRGGNQRGGFQKRGRAPP
ncbi:GSCOCG00012261001-RA-CDS, partial [Cotesia congregata]